jgi:uncharacterized protein
MRCPICKREVNQTPDASPEIASFLPFCSERCKLIDLGRWLSDKYQIPVTPSDPQELPPAIPRPDDNEDD